MWKDYGHVLKKSHLAKIASLSLSLSFYLYISHLFLKSRGERRITFERRAGQENRERSTHLYPNGRYMPYATMATLSCVHDNIHTCTHIHTHTRTRVVTFTEISSLLSEALTKVGQGRPTFCALVRSFFSLGHAVVRCYKLRRCAFPSYLSREISCDLTCLDLVISTRVDIDKFAHC